MLNNQEIKIIMHWLSSLGIDETLSPVPVDRTNVKAASPAINAPSSSYESPAKTVTASFIPSTPSPSALAPAASASLAATIAEARKLADKATTLEDLRHAVSHFDGCTLKKTAKNTVFSDGIPGSPVMLIGEAPGADEDRQGIPFCGASGQLLDMMLKSIGLERSRNFYITNTLFWRPPGNRTPTPDELNICLPFVEKHIAISNPKLLILVGGTAAKNLLGETAGITRLRTRKFEYKNQYIINSIPTRVVFHPSYLLRQPAHKRMAWQDLLAIRAFMKEEIGLIWH